jgi:hypothetical protein
MRVSGYITNVSCKPWFCVAHRLQPQVQASLAGGYAYPIAESIFFVASMRPIASGNLAGGKTLKDRQIKTRQSATRLSI